MSSRPLPGRCQLAVTEAHFDRSGNADPISSNPKKEYQPKKNLSPPQSRANPTSACYVRFRVHHRQKALRGKNEVDLANDHMSAFLGACSLACEGCRHGLTPWVLSFGD